MNTIPKTTRAAQIAACIEIVAKYFGVNSHQIVASFAPKQKNMVRSRVILWHHLHRSGMSFAAIARIFGKLSPDNVSRQVRYGMLSVTAEETLLLSTLPKIETSLQITAAKI